MKTLEKTDNLEKVLSDFKIEEVLKQINSIKEKSLPILKTKDIEDPGPEVKIGSDKRVDLESLGNLERIINRKNFLPASFLEEGAIIQRAVARVVFKEPYGNFDTGDGWATGFMVSPSLFMTNNHVISSKNFAKKFKAQFNYQNDLSGNSTTTDEYIFDPEDVFFTDSSLDVTLIRVQKKHQFSLARNRFSIENEYTPNPLDPIHKIPQIDIHNLITDDLIKRWMFSPIYAGNKWGYIKLNKNPSYAKDQFLNIIQHPNARRKEVALQENLITKIFSNKIQYTTDTEPGSSGSPVFNNHWDLVGLHHSAGERNQRTNKWVSNQGIRIDKIIAALKNNFNGTVSGNNILTELGL